MEKQNKEWGKGDNVTVFAINMLYIERDTYMEAEREGERERDRNSHQLTQPRCNPHHDIMSLWTHASFPPPPNSSVEFMTVSRIACHPTLASQCEAVHVTMVIKTHRLLTGWRDGSHVY